MRSIIIGSDHAGFEYKEQLQLFLNKNEIIGKYFPGGIRCIDVGCYSNDSVDYPDYVHIAMKNSLENNAIVILICGSGNGVSMTANKYTDKRAAVCWNSEIAELARKHNNANVLCIPARFVSVIEARKILITFLNTEFEGGRHERRVRKINISSKRIKDPFSNLKIRTHKVKSINTDDYMVSEL